MAGRGQPKTGGRQKGTPNKVTRDVKEMILGALTNLGGVAYLEECGKGNPAAFLALIGKVLPLQVAADAGGPIFVVTGIDRTKSAPEVR